MTWKRWGAVVAVAALLGLGAARGAVTGPAAFTLGEVDANGSITRSVVKAPMGVSVATVHYYRVEALGFVDATLPLLPGQAADLPDLILTGWRAPAGWLVTLERAQVVKDEMGRALVRLALDVQATGPAGWWDVTVLVRNRKTGQDFVLPMTVKVN